MQDLCTFPPKHVRINFDGFYVFYLINAQRFGFALKHDKQINSNFRSFAHLMFQHHLAAAALCHQHCP